MCVIRICVCVCLGFVCHEGDEGVCGFWFTKQKEEREREMSCLLTLLRIGSLNLFFRFRLRLGFVDFQ